jgi:hypothetical protein
MVAPLIALGVRGKTLEIMKEPEKASRSAKVLSPQAVSERKKITLKRKQ